ncbi:MAG: dockerin type I domain-containing protein [Oscillospiraceae bacterium]|nr:dockerin type I domain-containing protein [Oscillospiraceae bacterium]
MKKTKRTLITAAVLTTAALNPKLSSQADDNAEAMAPVYGPPSYFYEKGDVNMDGKVNILDCCLMRSAALGQKGYTEDSLTDINTDGIIDSRDVLAIQNFMLAKSQSVQYREDETTQPEYGVVTATETTTQPVYGTMPATETTTQAVPVYGTMPATEMSEETTTTQPVYESFPVTEEPIVTSPQPVYGTWQADEETEPEYENSNNDEVK